MNLHRFTTRESLWDATSKVAIPKSLNTTEIPRAYHRL